MMDLITLTKLSSDFVPWLQVVIPPLLTAVLSYGLGRRAEAAKIHKYETEAAATSARVKIESDASLEHIVNSRIELVMRAFEAATKASEARIEDLTREVHELRAEIIALRKARDHLVHKPSSGPVPEVALSKEPSKPRSPRVSKKPDDQLRAI